MGKFFGVSAAGSAPADVKNVQPADLFAVNKLFAELGKGRFIRTAFAAESIESASGELRPAAAVNGLEKRYVPDSAAAPGHESIQRVDINFRVVLTIQSQLRVTAAQLFEHFPVTRSP